MFLTDANFISNFRGMQTKERPIPVDQCTMSQAANAYIISVAAQKQITPQEAVAFIVETVARGKKNVTRNINAKKKEEVEA